MPFQPAPKIALVEIIYRLAGETVENTFHAFNSNGWNAQSLSNMVALVASWAEDQLMPRLSADLQLVEVQATDLGAQVSAQVSYSFPVGVLGGLAVPALPNNVAFCVTLLTALRGRSARGRMYITGIPETVVTNNTVTQEWSGQITTAVQSLRDQLFAASIAMVVCSRQTGGAPRPEAVGYWITTALAKDPTVDSQRRRLPGRGQ